MNKLARLAGGSDHRKHQEAQQLAAKQLGVLRAEHEIEKHELNLALEQLRKENDSLRTELTDAKAVAKDASARDEQGAVGATHTGISDRDAADANAGANALKVRVEKAEAEARALADRLEAAHAQIQAIGYGAGAEREGQGGRMLQPHVEHALADAESRVQAAQAEAESAR